MKSYIKLYGPPILKAIHELETIAIETPEVCIMENNIEINLPDFQSQETVYQYFNSYLEVSRERCDNLISKSGESLGQHDFYFEWFTKPTMKQLNDLIERIDNSLEHIGCKYSITTF